MKFSNGRVSRDRKRSPQEIAEWIKIVRQREEQKSLALLQITLKLGRIAALSFILINLILFIDVYLMAPQTKYATITEANVVHSRGGRSFNIHISSGKFWTVENTGYDNAGTKLKYQETLLFKIGFRIYNINRNSRILRSYDAFSISKTCSILFIFLGLLVFIYKPIGKNELYASLITLIAAGQDVLLLL